jgi:tRNA A-37 threonylcarbamoyl transferase component Bud32/CheY-like chemotaxis protein
MRILIVDDNADFCAVLREYLREGLERAARTVAAQGTQPDSLAVKTWRPVGQGVPAEGQGGFKWNFDALIINSLPEGSATLEWIIRARSSAGAQWPAVLLLIGGPEAEATASAALKVGVSDFVPRLQLTPVRLYESLMAAVRKAAAAREAAAQQAAEKARALALAQEPTIIGPRVRPAKQGSAAAATLAGAGQEASLELSGARTGTSGAMATRRRSAEEQPQIRGYTIERMIGEGGTARVYLAKRDGDGLQVVLKVLLPEFANDPAVVSRFMQEFSLIQKIKSAHVTRIFDLNYDDGNAYLAMEYFGFGDLRERVVPGGMPADQALKIFSQVARALGAIHDAGVVHRDLKPHNIMFRDPTHLAIVDFGGAKSLGETAGLTKVGHVIGTPNYMSPEQITGAPVDLRSDLYSLGVILHLLLTGQTLYLAPSPTELMEMHLNAPIPRLPEALGGFQKLLNKLVAKDPAARFQSARELYAYTAY